MDLNQPKPRYIIHDASEALQPQEPMEYLVEPIITRGSVNVFYGEAGSKKTYSLLSLTVCVGAGLDWLGFKTKISNILIIDEESGNKRLTRRLGETLRGALVYEPTNIKYVSLAGFKLDDTADCLLVMNLIEETNAELVLIDALSEIMDGDENAKKDVQPVFNNLRKIAEETNAAIILIHHSNKIGGYRGSSVIKGSVDLMIEVTSTDDSELVKFTSKKERDIERINWMAKAVWENDQFYLQSVSLDDQILDMPEPQVFIVESLKQHGKLFIKDLETMGTNDNFTGQGIRNSIKVLDKAGIIIRCNEGGKGKAAQYKLRMVNNE